MEVTDLSMMASSGRRAEPSRWGWGQRPWLDVALRVPCVGCRVRCVREVCVCVCGRVGEPGCGLSGNRPGALPAVPGPSPPGVGWRLPLPPALSLKPGLPAPVWTPGGAAAPRAVRRAGASSPLRAKARRRRRRRGGVQGWRPRPGAPRQCAEARRLRFCRRQGGRAIAGGLQETGGGSQVLFGGDLRREEHRLRSGVPNRLTPPPAPRSSSLRPPQSRCRLGLRAAWTAAPRALRSPAERGAGTWDLPLLRRRFHLAVGPAGAPPPGPWGRAAAPGPTLGAMSPLFHLIRRQLGTLGGSWLVIKVMYN